RGSRDEAEPRTRPRHRRGQSRRARACPRDRPGLRDLRGRQMSFGRPLLLLTLLAVPLAVLALRLVERRRMRYAVKYTNLEVLAAVAGGRPWRRYVPTGLALLALATLCVAFARPHATSLVPKERATVILVLDVSGSMQSSDV